jgi:hypothetical protein
MCFVAASRQSAGKLQHLLAHVLANVATGKLETCPTKKSGPPMGGPLRIFTNEWQRD